MSNSSKTRFANLSEEELNQLLADKDSANTKKATEHAVRVFRAYLNEKNIQEDFENFSVERLDSVLAKFYAESRSKSGDLYKKTSLSSIRHGLNRHLPDYDIVKGLEFKSSQASFNAMMAELKRKGAGGIEHHPPVEPLDLQKLYESFDIFDPTSLQDKVFLDIMLHFGRRGRENLRTLSVSDFALRADPDGSSYLYMVKDELTKNHQLDTNTAEGRMYEVKAQDEKCPVRTFLRYKRLLPPGNTWLFPKPLKMPTKQGYYFAQQPMGHNRLGNMMTRMSEEAKLSKKYTNHSLRATSVHVLDSARVPTRHIMSVTGHKSENSLKTYTGQPDSKAKKFMSHTISKSLGLPIEEENENTVPKRLYVPVNDVKPGENHDAKSEDSHNFYQDIDLGSAELKPLSNSQMENILKDFHSDDVFDQEMFNIEMDMGNKQLDTGNKRVVSNKVQSNFNLPYMSIPAPVISGQGATININYNFFCAPK